MLYNYHDDDGDDGDDDGDNDGVDDARDIFHGCCALSANNLKTAISMSDSAEISLAKDANMITDGIPATARGLTPGSEQASAMSVVSVAYCTKE
jgi:hypothetical protein